MTRMLSTLKSALLLATSVLNEIRLPLRPGASCTSFVLFCLVSFPILESNRK